MKILIISPGKAHDAGLVMAIAEFQKRLSAHYTVEWHLPGASDIAKEAAAILKPIKTDDVVVLLDEQGKDISTKGLSELLNTHLQQGTKRLVFVIGGAFGVDSSVRTRANTTLKLSSLTLPHMLVRLLLIEQLYRAQSMLSGSKYHHA